MFDEEPDAPLHGECAAEIQRQAATLAALRELARELGEALESVKHPLEFGLMEPTNPAWARHYAAIARYEAAKNEGIL
jgi:hypothetical protein